MIKDLSAIARETKYPLDAFLFVQRGLSFTVRRIHGESEEAVEPANRHVTGKMLCHGLRDYAIEQYGLMAQTVMRRWRVTSCEDFGEWGFFGGLAH